MPVSDTSIRKIKAAAPELLVITDLCCCEYTDHGHCGVLIDRGGHHDVDNDATLDLLARQAVSHARAGADVIAPSGMMDGMVAAIRAGLDAAKFAQCFDNKQQKPGIDRDIKDGEAVGVSGTPAFFLNGRSIEGAQPFESFKRVIDEELAAQKTAKK